jgi:hypothetical protein
VVRKFHSNSIREAGTLKRYHVAAYNNVGQQAIPKWFLRALGMSLKATAKKKAQPIEITP